MIHKNANKESFFLRQGFVIVLTFFVLLSSCATKRSIRNLLNLPTSTTKSLQTTHFKRLASFHDNCICCEQLQVLSIDSNNILLSKNVSPAPLPIQVISLLLNSIASKEVLKPIYYASSTLEEIPKYLLFNKLILYNA